MPRYKLVIEYDGTPFVGWQSQANGASVQQAIEEAIARFSGERLRIQCAGRTDAGVHAEHQVAHCDLARDWPTDTVRDAINAYLKPRPVAVLAVSRVGADFDARRSAVRRRYRYRILNRRAPPTFDLHRVWHIPWPLDEPAMREAAGRLLGRHDFTTFRAAECQATSPIRTMERLDVVRVGAEISIEAEARSFLHHQIRSIAGTLMWAGTGRFSADDVQAALEARDRARCGPMAPAAGLTFTGVDYPDEEAGAK